MFRSTNVPSTKVHSTKVSSTKVPQPQSLISWVKIHSTVTIFLYLLFTNWYFEWRFSSLYFNAAFQCVRDIWPRCWNKYLLLLLSITFLALMIIFRFSNLVVMFLQYYCDKIYGYILFPLIHFFFNDRFFFYSWVRLENITSVVREASVSRHNWGPIRDTPSNPSIP